ncbi:MAG TPA: hypothetical protein VF581_04490 [Flavobacterium sp.]|jgi:hypothetical protein
MERQMYHYATVSQALAELNEKGFTKDFNLEENKIVSNPEDYEIVHIYRYEGESDPGDEATIYGIKSKHGENGVFVSGHFDFSDDSAGKVLHDISIRGRENRPQPK